MAIALSLLCSVLWGCSDYVGGIASRRAPALAVVITGQVVAVGLLVVLAVAIGGDPSPAAFGWGAVAGVTGSVGLLFFYRALAGGHMSVAAPAAAVTSALVPLAFALASGEDVAALALAGAAVGLVAIVLVSVASGGGSGGADGAPHLPADRAREEPGGDAGASASEHRGLSPRGNASGPEAPTRRVLVLALVGGLGFGVFFVTLSRSPDDAGLWPLLAARLASSSGLSLWAVVSGATLLVRGTVARLAVVAGVGDVVANASFLVATRRGSLAVVAVLSSMYPGVTVLLARTIDHEPLRRVQVAGLGLALAAVALIAAA
jgi:drug/metabolite transporter (DMT)-like permease